MATNQTFDQLITRIDVATTELENATTAVTESTSDVAAQVVEAKAAANQSKQSATNATTQANTATLQASKATTEANKAVQAVEEAKALAPFQEAPKDAQTYGRKDGVWTVVTGGSGGTVTSVNNTQPDASGNVQIEVPTPVAQVNSDWNATSGKAQILNKPNLFSGKYSDLTNKPTIPSNTSQLNNNSGFIADAPTDGEQYARSNGSWVVVEAGGGGGGTSGGYATTESFVVSSKYYEQWLNANPNDPIDLANVANYADGEYLTGKELINQSGLQSIPAGKYAFISNTFNTAPLQGKQGYVEVYNASATTTKLKTAKATTVDSVTGEVTGEYTFNGTNGGWLQSTKQVSKVGVENWNVNSGLKSLGIIEPFVGMLWTGAFGASTVLSKTQAITGANSPDALPVGLYRITADAQYGGTSSSTPFQGRQVIMLVLEFLPSVGATRTGATANKSVLAMSWAGNTGADIKLHIWTGDKVWITK